MFVAIGHTPTTALFAGQVAMDAEGYILTAAGQHAHLASPACSPPATCRTSIFRQAVTAAGTGCMAALEAEKWLAEQGGRAERWPPSESPAEFGRDASRAVGAGCTDAAAGGGRWLR